MNTQGLREYTANDVIPFEIMESIGAGIWEWDVRKKELATDRACKKLAGYEEQELPESSLDWKRWCHPEDRRSLYHLACAAVRKKRDRFCAQCRIRRNAGAYFWVKITACIVYDQQKQPVRIVGAIIDISWHKKALAMQSSYEVRRRSDIFNDLLNGVRHLDEDLTVYVRTLGLNFDQALFCCVIQASCKVGNDDNLQDLQDGIINTIHGIQGCIAWSCRGKIGAVCQMRHYSGSRRKLAEEFYVLVKGEHPEVSIHIGIGESQKGLTGFHKSFQQAWDAAAASSKGLICDKDIVYFRDIGIFQLLLNKEGMERAADFTCITLQKLIKYDSEKGTDYLNTLEVILQSANLKEAAQTLFLHHNTINFRKRRIEEILGQSLADFDTKLSLALAIKFYRLSVDKK